jgi:CBS domain-containing protein
MLTDRDLAMACYTQGKAPAEVAVAGAMSSSIYSVRPDDSLADVIALMKLHKVRRVPVSNEAGHLLGMVSVSDVLRRLGEQRHGSPLQLAVMQALTIISAKARH